MRINAFSVLKAALVLVFLYALFLLRDLVLVVLTAVVIAAAVEPGTKWMIRRKIPRLLGVVVIYLVSAAVIFGIFYVLVPPLLKDMSSLLAQAPEYINTIDVLGSFESLQEFDIEGSQEVVEGIRQGVSPLDFVQGLSDYITRIPGGAFNTVSTVFGGAVSLILIIVISFYLAMQERGIDNLLKVVVPFKHQKYALNLWDRTQKKIGQWMQGQLLLGVLIAVLVYLGLTILGVKHALLFAILAGVFELIPLFGPILASIPAIALGFVDGGITLALLIAGVYIIIQQFENHLIYPLVVHKVVGVPALLVILALIIGGQLAGFLGIILAVPIATVLMELVKDVKKKNQKKQEKLATNS